MGLLFLQVVSSDLFEFRQGNRDPLRADRKISPFFMPGLDSPMRASLPRPAQNCPSPAPSSGQRPASNSAKRAFKAGSAARMATRPASIARSRALKSALLKPDKAGRTTQSASFNTWLLIL
jgi:hypothetical protein